MSESSEVTVKKGSSPVPLVIFLLLVVGAVAIGGTAILSPQSLVFFQEQTLGIIHGGVVDRNEQKFEECIQTNEGTRVITGVRRVTRFRDGTSLETVFRERPLPSDRQC